MNWEQRDASLGIDLAVNCAGECDYLRHAVKPVIERGIGHIYVTGENYLLETRRE